LEQLALAIGQPREEAGRRLGALAQTYWKEQPLFVPEHDPAGAIYGATLAPVERLAVSGVAEANQLTEASANFSAALVHRLKEVGLNPAQIDRLAGRHSEAEVSQQLDWLPARGARNPAALLIRAVEQQWEQPKELA
jgi:hypothetical protein